MPELILTEAQWIAAAVAAKAADFVAWDNLRWTTHIGADGKPDGQTQALYSADVDKDAFVEDVPADIVTAVTGFAADTTAPLINYAGATRWEYEQAGVVVDLGGGSFVTVPTDREGRAALKQARDMLRDGELLDENDDVLTDMAVVIGTFAAVLNEAQATALLKESGKRVQALYSTHASVLSDIASGTITTEAQINAAFGGE
ncbi:MAG: hypothetical protein RIC14_05725 [Filomicrobium sp.]